MFVLDHLGGWYWKYKLSVSFPFLLYSYFIYNLPFFNLQFRIRHMSNITVNRHDNNGNNGNNININNGNDSHGRRWKWQQTTVKKMGPNDASGVIWALGEFLLYISHSNWYLIVYIGSNLRKTRRIGGLEVWQRKRAWALGDFLFFIFVFFFFILIDISLHI